MNKQLEILNFLSTVGVATIDEIYKNVSFGYYHNASKHLSTILSGMVKNGTIERVKPGTFKFLCKRKYFPDNVKQLNLFNQ